MTSIISPQGSSLRRARLARGLSQSGLARLAGISRQALSAVESGTYAPSVTVALRLAAVLGQSVESLFGEGEPERIKAEVAGGNRDNCKAGAPVALGRVNGRLVAVPRSTVGLQFVLPSGVVERAAPGGRSEVSSFRSAAEIDSTLLVAGCDPAVSVLADWLMHQTPAVAVVGLPLSSGRTLDALAAGAVHVGGIHLRDPRSGEYNLGPTHAKLGARRALIVSFARWEVGMAVASSNPLGIRGVADVARRGVRLINRDRGAGARAVLDEMLAAEGIGPRRVTGYGTEAAGHLEVAEAVAQGRADAGITLRVAAAAYGLHFIPLREERYDLVIPRREIDRPPVRALLNALASSRLARTITRLCSYDTAAMGKVIVPA